MIIKKRDESTVSATCEDADDLLALRRVIRQGDVITGSTTRVIKRDKDYSRPDRGERVRITVSIIVEKISLDGTLERLRIGGTVQESNNDAVAHGTHHSMTITVSDTIAITKKGPKSEGKSRWSHTDYTILRGDTKSGKRTSSSFLLVAIDTSDCGVAILKGTHLKISPNMYSGRGGKRYKTNHSMDAFFAMASSAIDAVLEDEKRVERVILFGPGNTKKEFANYMNIKSGQRKMNKCDITITEGIDASGEDGIHMFTKSDAMRESISGSKMARVSDILDKIIEHAHKKIPRYAMGYEETQKAVNIGAIDALIFSDMALQQYGNEQKMIDLLNAAEESGAEVYGVDSTTDIGLRASGLGGVVALLRYAIV